MCFRGLNCLTNLKFLKFWLKCSLSVGGTVCATCRSCCYSSFSKTVDVFWGKTCTFWNSSEFSCGRTAVCVCTSRCSPFCLGVLFAHPLCAATWRTSSDESKTSSGAEFCHGALGFLGLSFPFQREVQSQCCFLLALKTPHLPCVQEKSLTYHALFLTQISWHFTKHTGKLSVLPSAQ